MQTVWAVEETYSKLLVFVRNRDLDLKIRYRTPMVDSTKVLCSLFDGIEILILGDSPSIFPSLDKT